MNLFEKYGIYDKKHFLSITVYIVRSILNGTIVFENDYQYCIGFYVAYFQSVPISSASSETLLKLVQSQNVDPNNNNMPPELSEVLPVPSANFGLLVDTLMPLLSQRALTVADFENVSPNVITAVQVSPTSVTLNGVESNTARGCAWKLLYANLIYKLNQMI